MSDHEDAERIEACSRPLRADDVPDDVLVTVLADKRVLAYSADNAWAIALGDALLGRWDSDAHIVQYVGADMRLRKSEQADDPIPVGFHTAWFDLDVPGHQIPAAGAFGRLVPVLTLLDQPPNITYETRHGCRIIYLIVPIDDAELFERAYLGLMQVIQKPLNHIAAEYGYELDRATKDWTRTFRLPRVKRDGVTEHNCRVLWLHSRRLNMASLEVERPRKYSTDGLPINTSDRQFSSLLASIEPGVRNVGLNKAVWYTQFEKDTAKAKRMIDMAARKALAEGMGESECERIVQKGLRRLEGRS